MMKRKLINIFICCTICICSNAQTEGYKFYAALDSITTSGFYNIVLTPNINAHLKTDYSDVRIVNAAGKWVPHALHVPANQMDTMVSVWDLNFSEIKSDKINSIFVIEGGNLTIDNLELGVRSTAAERYCSLSGSDDKVNWFVINDSILLDPTPTKKVNDFRLDFPPSNYRFYKLVIVNSNRDPFQIVRISTIAFVQDPEVMKSSVMVNPIASVFQKDSGKISYIKVTQEQPYHFDGLNLKLSGVKYFKRTIELFAPVDSQHSFSNPGHMVATFTVSNYINFSFPIPLINPSVFYLKIYNEDNLPLKVNQVNTTIKEHFIQAYLEKNESYRLIMGNENASLPNYDIAKLNITLKDTSTFIKLKDVITFPQQSLKQDKKTNNKWLIWIALIAGLFILLLLTKKLLTELDKKNNHDSI